MPSLDYSPEALSTLPSFHRVKCVVYVEGPDDVPYWNRVFEDAGLASFFVKPAGGRSELDKYQESILQLADGLAVARDADFDILLGRAIDDRRVMYTYGYAIENSLYSSPVLCEVVRTLARTAAYDAQRVDEWHQHNEAVAEPVVVMDVCSRHNDLNLTLPAGSCASLLQDKDRSRLCPGKVAGAIAKVRSKVTDEVLEQARRLVTSSAKPIRWHVRGHFLTAAVIQFLKASVKAVGAKRLVLSNDALYGLCMGHYKLAIVEPAESEFLVSQVRRLNTAA